MTSIRNLIQYKADILFWLMYLVVLLGYVPSRGYYSTKGIFILLIGMGLLFIYSRLKVGTLINGYYHLVVILLIGFGLSLQYLGIGSVITPEHFKNIKWIYFLAIAITPMFIFRPQIRVSFWILFGLAILVRLLVISFDTNPPIDVFDFLNNGVGAFLSGHNPYSQIFHFGYLAGETPNYYGYFPVTILLSIPGYLLGHDVRLGYVIMDLIGGLLVYKLLIKKHSRIFTELLTLIFLFNPLIAYTTEFAWIEPMMIFLLIVFVYSYYFHEKLWPWVLGLFFAAKQFNILFLPFVLLLRKNNFKNTLIFTLTAEIIVLLFLLWSPADFIYDTVIYHFNLPFRLDGLTIYSFIYQRFGLYIPIWISFVVTGIVFLLSLVRYSKLSLHTFLVLSVLVSLAFFILSKQAFVNYFQFYSQVLLLAYVVRGYQDSDVLGHNGEFK